MSKGGVQYAAPTRVTTLGTLANRQGFGMALSARVEHEFRPPFDRFSAVSDDAL